MNRALVIKAAAASLSLALCGVAGADIKLEGLGTDRREKQNALQFQAVPADLWSSISAWSDGKGPTSELLSGKAVLVVTWAGWYKAGDSAVRLAQSMADKYGSKGLVVLGVHNTRGADGSKAAAERLGVKFPTGIDADGKFRERLMLDQDPDFVVIDRTGAFRYVDIETGSVEAAVSEVLGETTDQALARPGEVAAASTKAAADALRTRDVSGILAPGQTVSVEFELPEKEAYDNTKWPFRVRGEGKYEFDKLSDKLIHEPPSMKLPTEEGYKPFVPQTKGKLSVVYFIDPKVRQTLNVLPLMNNIQELYRRDGVVIGVTAKFGVEAFGLSPEDAAKLVERNEPLVDDIMRTRPMNHAVLYNLNGLGVDKIRNIGIYGNTLDEAAVCVILSTDGTMRWIGHPGEDGFKVQMNKLIEVDPGVKIRRKAEDAKLKAGKQ